MSSKPQPVDEQALCSIQLPRLLRAGAAYRFAVAEYQVQYQERLEHWNPRSQQPVAAPQTGLRGRPGGLFEPLLRGFHLSSI